MAFPLLTSLFYLLCISLGVGASTFTGKSMSTLESTYITRSGRGDLSMMRHRKRLAKLGKPADQRKALPPAPGAVR